MTPENLKRHEEMYRAFNQLKSNHRLWNVVITQPITGAPMNCANAKLGTRFNHKINSKTWCTDIISGDITIPATIIGFEIIGGERSRVLIGWSHRDTIRPSDSDQISSLASGSMYEYVDNVEEYSFGSWKVIDAEFVASWIDDPIEPSEWQCPLPGCKKMNDMVAKCCYMCGNLR
jgi:hypothetical protein